MILACDLWDTQCHINCCSAHILKLTLDFPGLVTVSIERKNLKTGVNEVIQPKDLHKDYEQWITLQHCTHDTGPIFEESDVIFCSTSRHKDELKLNMTDEGEKASINW